MKEIERLFFKSVQDGVFEIDSKGRIWRLARYNRMETVVPMKRQRAEVVTGHSIEKHKYLAVMVRIGKYKCRKAMAHRLVWASVHGDIDNSLEINHKDGQKDNNHPDNLELATRQQNMQHAFKNGFMKSLEKMHGNNHPNSKLRKVEVDRIRQIHASGLLTKSELSRMFGVNASTIAKVVKGKTWFHDD